MSSPLAALKGIASGIQQNQEEAAQAGQSIGAKTKMIQEYKDSLKPSASSPARPAGKPSNVDRVKPGAKYGDRQGEQRIDVKDIVKPLGSFKKGTSKVKKTAVYKLHKGEAVVPAKAALKMRALFGDSDKDGK